MGTHDSHERARIRWMRPGAAFAPLCGGSAALAQAGHLADGASFALLTAGAGQ